MSDDQIIESVDADHVCVTATVRDTAQLDWWLLGFGSAVLVLEPSALADRVADATVTEEAVKQAAPPCVDTSRAKVGNVKTPSGLT